MTGTTRLPEDGQPDELATAVGQDLAYAPSGEVEAPELVDGHPVRPEISHLVHEMMVGWAGPMPPPNAVREYEDILPGAAERILSMAEMQVAHRHDLERRTTQSMIRVEERGQWIGAGIAVLAILVGGFLIATDHDGWGFATVLTAVATLLASAIFGRRKQEGDLAERRRELERAQERERALADEPTAED